MTASNTSMECLPVINRSRHHLLRQTFPLADEHPDLDTIPHSAPHERPRVSRQCFPSHAVLGLDNLGNSCYLNSCVQCLAHLPAFAQYFYADVYLNDLHSPIQSAVAIAFANLMKTLWLSTKVFVARPTDFRRAINKHSEQFDNYDQHDAQEFLCYLLNALHSATNRVTCAPMYVEMKEQKSQMDREISHQFWEVHKDHNESFISDLFCGQLRSEIVCRLCQNRSVCFDVFWDVSLPIPKLVSVKSPRLSPLRNVFRNRAESDTMRMRKKSESRDKTDGKGLSLKECFELFTAPEQLLQGYACTKCKRKEDIWKNAQSEKVNTCLEYPLLGLDLASYCAVDAVLEGGTLYDLKAVVHHAGSLHDGHYTAVCYNSKMKHWYRINDAVVNAISLPSLHSASPYILFYQRRAEQSLSI